MSMDFDQGLPTQPETMRGRDWPCLRQFGVFMENRVGSLHELLRKLERSDLRVVALSIVDTIDHAVARLVLNNYERGLELLEFSNQTFFESDVIGVELPDHPQPHLAICQALMQAEVNIHYTYPLLYRRNGRSAVVLYVDDIDQALRSLKQSRLQVITENDLEQDDQYFLE